MPLCQHWDFLDLLIHEWRGIYWSLTCNFLNSKLNFMGCVWLWCSGYSLLRDPQYKKGLTNTLVIWLTPCYESILAVMLTKTEVSAGFIYYWIRTSATRVPLTIQKGGGVLRKRKCYHYSKWSSNWLAKIRRNFVVFEEWLKL